MRYYIDGVDILSEPCKNALKQIAGTDEKILFCVASRRKKPNMLQRDRVYQSVNGYRNWLDGLVFFNDRLVFFHGPKFGFVVLGNVEKQPLAYRSIDYKEVTSISVDSSGGANIYFIVNGVSMIMPRESEKELRELESWLRTTVRQKSQQVIVTSDTTQSGDKDVVQQLEKLAELHKSGALTDEEFTTMKKKLMEG